MLTRHIVCLCFGEDHCKETTMEIAKRNNAIDWFVDPVRAPITSEIAYRGTIVLKEVM